MRQSEEADPHEEYGETAGKCWHKQLAGVGGRVEGVA